MSAAEPGRAAQWLHQFAEAERLRFAPWFAVALGAGVLLYFALPAEPPAAAVWVTPPLVLFALLVGAWRGAAAGWASGLVAALALGFAAALWHAGRQPAPLDLPRGAVVVTGKVASVDILPEGRRVTLERPRLGEGEPALPRRIRVRLRSEDPARPAPGDVLSVRALVRPPVPPAYPGAWDFQRAAFFSGLGGSGFAIGRASVEPGAESVPLAGLRAEIEARTTAALPGGAGAIAAALLTGGQSAIPAADLAAMRDSGLAHLLSVSGLHIAIVMGVSFAVLRFALAAVPPLALRLPGKPLAAVGALGVGGFYMLLTGAEVPMQRSFAMAALATLALLTGRRAISMRGLALAAAVVLLLQPAAVLGPSFQMSFAAVMALIAGWEWLRPRLPPPERRWRRRIAVALFGTVATSILAGAATTPFGLHHFGRLQLYGVVANAVAVPLTSALIMPAGMAAVALMPLGLEGLALAPMGWGVEAVLAVARAVAAWPGAAVPVPPITAGGLCVVAFGMAWLCLWRSRWRLLGVPVIVAGFVAGAAQRPPDMLVSADARLIALRTGDGLLLQRLSGASNLTRDVWLRLYGRETAELLPPQRAGTFAGGAIACEAGACAIRPSPAGAVAAVLLRGDPPAWACAGAPLVVSAEPVRGRCAARVVDRFSVWRDGAHAVWLEPAGPRVLSDREARGARPWVPPQPKPRNAAAAREAPPQPTPEPE
ncbi:ComEC/Rec2 family competence protein [Craurococcus roseus]|uniref:ComEC/Rec2 family competence protein n=1 Tax=Craurococcus roseus TaxID=77585 RepID=UPI0031DEB8A0